MNDAQEITFAPLKKEDIELLLIWLKRPHVLEFWPQSLSDLEIRKKYESHIESSYVFPYLILKDQNPIGYIQTAMTWREHQRERSDEKEGAFSVDLFLGEPNDLNRGLGTKVLKRFVEYLFTYFKAKSIVIDVNPKNHRALACYQKVGFIAQGESVTPEGNAILMRLHSNL